MHESYAATCRVFRRYALHTSVLEGINNKIKGIKRMAYGFRDDECFFLKIHAASAELGDEPNNCGLQTDGCAQGGRRAIPDRHHSKEWREPYRPRWARVMISVKTR